MAELQISEGVRPFEVTNRMVMAISVPMAFASLSTPLLGIVDTAVVGQFRNATLIGGLAIGSTVFGFVFASFNFLRTGTSGLVAQAFGQDDIGEQQAVFWRAIVIALVLGDRDPHSYLGNSYGMGWLADAAAFTSVTLDTRRSSALTLVLT